MIRCFTRHKFLHITTMWFPQLLLQLFGHCFQNLVLTNDCCVFYLKIFWDPSLVKVDLLTWFYKKSRTKGQLNSEWIYDVFVFSNYQRIFFLQICNFWSTSQLYNPSFYDFYYSLNSKNQMEINKVIVYKSCGYR